MSYSALTFAVIENIGTITLNRPEKRNAISTQMIQELMSALDEAERADCLVVILTGAGKAFCSGMDLEMLAAISRQSPAENLQDSRRMAGMLRRIWCFPKPLIAAVNGAAIAGGCGIATLCDFTIAVPEAKFGYTEVRIGFIPAIVSVFLTRQIGDRRARDLLLSGRIFEAAEAADLGLVNIIVPQDKLLDTARELAVALGTSSPTSLRQTKRLLCDSAAVALDADLERAIAENARIRGTRNFQEGLAAYLEKRKPAWGRE